LKVGWDGRRHLPLAVADPARRGDDPQEPCSIGQELPSRAIVRLRSRAGSGRGQDGCRAPGDGPGQGPRTTGEPGPDGWHHGPIGRRGGDRGGQITLDLRDGAAREAAPDRKHSCRVFRPEDSRVLVDVGAGQVRGNRAPTGRMRPGRAPAATGDDGRWMVDGGAEHDGRAPSGEQNVDAGVTARCVGRDSRRAAGAGQVGGGELPLERLRGLVVACFERGEPFDDDIEIIEVVG